jgi:hypothetical protein
MKLTTGFFLADVVRSVVQFADTEERKGAIQRVADMLTSGCKDEHQWRAAIDELSGLCLAHPDRWRESGFWYDGDPCILAMALAMEAASVGLYKLYPTLYSQSQVDGCVYKVFKYLLRAMSQKPETAVTCLQWVERVLNLLPARDDKQ